MTQPRSETGADVYHEPPHVFNEDQCPQAYTPLSSAISPDNSVTWTKNAQRKDIFGLCLKTSVILLLSFTTNTSQKEIGTLKPALVYHSEVR